VEWSGGAAGKGVCPGKLIVRSCAEIRRGCREVSLSWAACCLERLVDPERLQDSGSVPGSLLSETCSEVRCGCRQVSPSCAADCPEKHHGLLLLLLLMGWWSVMLCGNLRRIPLLCWLCHAVKLSALMLLIRGHQYMWDTVGLF
jgi:hypothetical protein